ncbi:MAG: hypothetical protein JOZ99_08235 [Actinobacteria bacterium]|nr:hypothetical protein [Actinomycetota bacterium]
MGRRCVLLGLIVSVFLLVGASSAFADVYPNGGTTPTTATVDAATVTAPAPTSTVSPSTLAFTGGDVATLTGIGVAAIGVGVVLARRSRRSRRQLTS